MSTIRVTMFALLLAAVSARAADPVDPEPPAITPGKADVRGEVKTVSALKSRLYLGRLMIDGKKEKDTSHEKASVLVLAAAKVYFWKGGKKVEATFADVKVGCKVQCVFTGPVAESFPVQGRTTELIIIESPKK